MSVPPDQLRQALGSTTSEGSNVYNWRLTSTTISGLVHLPLPPNHILPVVFVPGIMGTNLMSNDRHRRLVWRLDTTMGQPAGLLRRMAFNSAGDRQRLMHPARTVVDGRGSVPSKAAGSVSRPEEYTTHRFWGEIAEGSYHAFLIWLEERLNGQGFNPAKWDDFFYTSVGPLPKPGQPRPEPILPPGIVMRMRRFEPSNFTESASIRRPNNEFVTSDDLLKRARFRMPVYACGYNWLDSNAAAANRLRSRINSIIAANNTNGRKCEQVIIVTHSMGGLVARCCALLSGMQSKIAGVVHGVMPATGAPVAYRRCKIGMRDESRIAGMVIGSNGQEVTAVFAQAPGALQLLPTTEYRREWLKINDEAGRNVASLPKSDPYSEIYLRRDRWWGLVRPEWLAPIEGRPITWDRYAANVQLARDFHNLIKGRYHERTYVYYGADPGIPSFENVKWEMKRGIPPRSGARPTSEQVYNMGFEHVRDIGLNPLRVGGEMRYIQTYSMGAGPQQINTSFYELSAAKQDGGGDGTVPTSSGRAPLITGGGGSIRQQFRMHGFEHEKSYRNSAAQLATLFSIYRIVSAAKAL